MRLTLRTMLAYLDDILEPGDAEELSQKIEESKFASDLVHRIRNSTRRLRLGAPQVEGRGMGLDANTVAEYLDNTLAPEHVPDFEKVCLESDVHLAEVASCHQILTLVLGEPADINQTARERIYRLCGPDATPSTVAPVHQEPAAPDQSLDAAPLDTLPGPPKIITSMQRGAPPDYMPKSSRFPAKSLVITLVAGFVLAVVALRAIGPFGPEHPVWQWFSGSDGAPLAETPGEAFPDPETLPSTESESRQETATVEPERTAPVDERPASETEAPPVLPPAPPTTTTDIARVPPGDTPTAMPESADSDVGPIVPPAPAPMASEVDTSGGVDEPEPADEREPPIPTVEEPAAPSSAGRYISEEQVLGRIKTEIAEWTRLATDSPVFDGDRLIALATYRPQLLLGSSVKITFSGESDARIRAEAEPDTPSLSMDYGRALVVSMADRGARVMLELSGRRGMAGLADAESTLAIEVLPYARPGSDPLTAPVRMIVRLYARSGQVTWAEAGEELVIEAGQVLLLPDELPAQVVDAGALPAWIEGRDLTDIERRASRELERNLATDRPLSLSLLENTEHRHVEVRALACRCLSGLNQFESILEALDDDQYRAYWHTHYDALFFAVTRNSQSASELQTAVKNLRSDDGEHIFRLILGYSPEQLEAGGAEELVDFLEHEEMIVRVLAYENLRRITGKTLQFRPEQPPRQETRKVINWRKNLEAGQIRYRTPPLSGDAPPVGADREPTGPGGT